MFFLGVALMVAGFTDKIQVPLPWGGKIVGSIGGVVTILAVMDMLDML